MLHSLFEDRWFFVTNTENLKSILVQGLITAPDGFIKYYKDELSICPGWIILTRNGLSKQLVDLAISEDETIRSCALEIKITDFKGNIRALIKKTETNHFSIVKIPVHELLSSQIDIILVPAPLSVSSIKQIIVFSKNDKENFLAEENLYSNLFIEKKTINVEQQLIDSKLPDLSVGMLKNLPNFTVDYSEVFAYGGILYNLFHFSKNGPHFFEAFDSFLNNNNDNASLLLMLTNDFFSKKKNNYQDQLSKIYYELIKILIKSNNFSDEVIDFLESDFLHQDDKSSFRAKQISKNIYSFLTLPDKPFLEYLVRAKSSLHKLLLLLSYVKDFEELYAFDLSVLDKEMQTDFVLLMGLKESFINIPKWHRKNKELIHAITNLMTKYIHAQNEDGLDFSEETFRLPTYYELFSKKEIKEWFCKKYKIDAYRTIVKIPKGSYQLIVSGSGIEFHFEGKPKYVETDFDEKLFFEALYRFHELNYSELYEKYMKGIS